MISTHKPILPLPLHLQLFHTINLCLSHLLTIGAEDLSKHIDIPTLRQRRFRSVTSPSLSQLREDCIIELSTIFALTVLLIEIILDWSHVMLMQCLEVEFRNVISLGLVVHSSETLLDYLGLVLGCHFDQVAGWCHEHRLS